MTPLVIFFYWRKRTRDDDSTHCRIWTADVKNEIKL